MYTLLSLRGNFSLHLTHLFSEAVGSHCQVLTRRALALILSHLCNTTVFAIMSTFCFVLFCLKLAFDQMSLFTRTNKTLSSVKRKTWKEF